MTLSIVRVSLSLLICLNVFRIYKILINTVYCWPVCSSHQHFCVTITGFSYDEFIVHLASK